MATLPNLEELWTVPGTPIRVVLSELFAELERG